MLAHEPRYGGGHSREKAAIAAERRNRPDPLCRALARGGRGDGTTDDRTRPDRVATDLTFERIAVGRNHACGLASDGTAHCWGGNGRGQLGDESNTDRSSPVPVAGGLTFQQLQSGQNHTCGVTSTGVAYCWGANGDGQLADGTFTDRSEPVRVPDPGESAGG